MALKIPTPDIPSGRIPAVVGLPSDANIKISLELFREADLFGIGKQPIEYHVSLLHDLRDLTATTKTELTSGRHASRWHFHDVDWEISHLSIADRNNLPGFNNEEITYCQLGHHKRYGRIIGFFVENIFYIVLLDPCHNSHPMQVDSTKALGKRRAPIATDFGRPLHECPATWHPVLPAATLAKTPNKPTLVLCMIDEGTRDLIADTCITRKLCLQDLIDEFVVWFSDKPP